MSVCAGVFDVNGTSLIAEEREGACKTARKSQRQRKATTTSPGVHGKLCLCLCLNGSISVCVCVHVSRVVTPMRAVLTAKNGHLDPYTKERGSHFTSIYYWVKGQNVHVFNSHQLISSMVKRSRSSGQAVKRSSSRSDGQNFLTLVLAVNTVRMGVTTPCVCVYIILCVWKCV